MAAIIGCIRRWQMSNDVLSAGRQIGAYVISADLINLRSYDAADIIELLNYYFAAIFERVLPM